MIKAAQTTILQAYQNAPWRSQYQALGVFALAVVMVAIVAAIYLNVTARAATIGRQVQALQEDILTFQRINADLETQLAKLSSTTVMEERAREMGFRPLDSGSIVYLKVRGYSGRQEVIFAPPPDPAFSDSVDMPGEYTETLYQWFGRLLREPDQAVSGPQQAPFPEP
jgi:cell division protein FtsB